MMTNPKLEPNTCPVPNVILDFVMRKVSHAEFKVLMAIVRKTYGWHKDSDRISLSQLVAMTGVSERKVIDSIRSLDWIVISHKKPKKTTEYRLNLTPQTGLGDAVTALPDPGHLLKSVQEGPEVSSGASPEVSSDTIDTLKNTKTKDIKERTPDYPQQFVEWYKGEYQSTLKQPLVVRWGRDKKLMKSILTAYPIEKAKVIARRLLNTADKWLLGTGRDIPVLANQWQKLVMEGTYRPGIDGPSLPSADEILAKEDRRRK